MEYHTIDGQLFTKMVLAGAKNLNKHVKSIDALNVFPVPDGDTGTNMNLSFTSGINELKKRNTDHVGKNAEALAKGLLMGARGNSGVILSQLFRGFSKHILSFEVMDSVQFAEALKTGVNTAYKAVMKPVEGTILTVAREMADEAIKISHKEKNIVVLMEEIIKRGKISLANTPELLPILKEVGVVDAGGKGLLYVYEGFLAILKDENMDLEEFIDDLNFDDVSKTDSGSFLTKISTESIEFGYCTEFFIGLDNQEFNEDNFKKEISEFGDSLVVISDDEIVKVHIHSNEPGTVLNYSMKYGSLHKLKIDNMREQHNHIIIDDANSSQNSSLSSKESKKPIQPYGIVAVGMGEGIVDIFKSIGVDKVVTGGQTMNPSTEDIVNAINEINAENYIILPNNSNIILAAEQTLAIVDKPIVVIPSKTMPQGIAALLLFNKTASLEENKKNMLDALDTIKTGQVTYSIRDTKFENLEISQGDFIGIADGKILTNTQDLLETSYNLLVEMIQEEDEILTIIYGEDVNEEQVRILENMLIERFPNIEIEIHNGKQPLYYFIFGIE
ncbi:MAG: DAK2 domain-containing protein [Vulcanibacillus sp.]